MNYNVGQKVLLNMKNFTMPKGLTPKFMSKFIGSFPVVECVFKDVYKLEYCLRSKCTQYFMSYYLNHSGRIPWGQIASK
jgi:hypothetical protein